MSPSTDLQKHCTSRVIDPPELPAVVPPVLDNRQLQQLGHAVRRNRSKKVFADKA